MNDFDLQPRDFLSLIEIEFSVEDQLIAIRDIFHRHRKAAEETTAELERCRAAANKLTGWAAEQAVDDFGMEVHRGIYEDAAHGLAAIALLSPLYEQVLHQSLLLIGKEFHSSMVPNPTHIRWEGSPKHRWDCHFVWNGKSWDKKIYEGTEQLLEATNLLRLLPPDFLQVFSAIIAYRNKMFHHGLEWPLAERIPFAQRIESGEWPASWFSRSFTGKNPWMFSLTALFVDRCITLVNEIVDVFGEYVRANKTA
jgi:hypothetical protein